MNLGKLTKRLRKELLANPKQAAVLAVVCLVALWFWGPLLLKWARPKAADAKAATPATAEAPVPGAAAATKEDRQFSWWEVQAWRDADPLTRSAAIADDARDPFATLNQIAIASQQEEEPDDTGETKPAIAERTVEQEKLGLVLESIAYSSSRRRAHINGQTVKENDELKLNTADKDEEARGPELVARVVAIRPSEVVLEIRGRAVQLKLQPKLLGRGEVVERTR